MYMRFFRSVTALAVVLAIWSGALAQSSGFDTTRMDRSADACDDFFQFANGTWVKNTEIPPSQSRWGSFNILSESNRDVLHDILENAVKQNAPAGSDIRLIGDFYASCMDETAIEKAGTKPLDEAFSQIAKAKTIDYIKHQIALIHKSGVPSLVRHGVGLEANHRLSVM